MNEVKIANKKIPTVVPTLFLAIFEFSFLWCGEIFSAGLKGIAGALVVNGTELIKAITGD
jgi:hypothetical protein